MNDDAMLRDHSISESESDEIMLQSPELDQLAQSIRSIAEDSQGDVTALLGLLRVLEVLHREIREGSFQEVLPSNRQALYTLLKDIESSGGWPYIPRMRLREFLRNLIIDDETCSETKK
jgi:hypothetical protein